MFQGLVQEVRPRQLDVPAPHRLREPLSIFQFRVTSELERLARARSASAIFRQVHDMPDSGLGSRRDVESKRLEWLNGGLVHVNKTCCAVSRLIRAIAAA